jgi:hypothetical protein
MKAKLLVVPLVIALVIGTALAWEDLPTDAEKADWKAALKNMTEREFGGIGVSGEDMQTSVYVYRRHTLANWTQTFKDAFANEGDNWAAVYSYVLDQIRTSELYETYGYFNLDDQTYWIENISLDSTSLTAELTYQNSTAGNISLHPLFWSFWTGELELNGENSNVVLLKFKK